MNFKKALIEKDLILCEAAVIEAVKRSGVFSMHPLLENALLIYDEAGRRLLSSIYRAYISVAHAADVPIIICSPTWRASFARVSEAGIQSDINGDAVKFLAALRDEWGDWRNNIFVGGLVGCKNDCYRPDQCLMGETAETYHSWQIDRLVASNPDFLMAATLPAYPEAVGIARAMQETGMPYMISFVIDRNGTILDGNPLSHAVESIDASCSRPPEGYMINCSYPSFLNASKQPESVLRRLIGYQANASSLDHTELDDAEHLHSDDVSDWGDRMLELHRRFGVKILGGCCGTNADHLKYIVNHLSAPQKSPLKGT